MIPLIPYQIRAVWQWCVDNNMTPYIVVYTKDNNKIEVPANYINADGTIILNISPIATQGLNITNTSVSFNARFNGRDTHIYFDIEDVMAIFSKENQMGLQIGRFGDKLEEQENPQMNDISIEKENVEKIDIALHTEDQNQDIEEKPNNVISIKDFRDRKQKVTR